MEAKELIIQSEKRLNKLKILTNFFNQAKVIAILVRTRVIHDVFSSNRTLDANKLELFHLQYTDSLLELLLKLKKNIEQKYLLLNNEIQINNDIIKSLENEVENDDFFVKVKQHNLVMQQIMERLYNELAYDKKSNQLVGLEKMNQLSNELGIEFYRKIALTDYENLHKLSTNQMYDIFSFRIEKKLLGKLNIQQFKFKFLCGLQFNNEFIEIYEFIHFNEYFVFFKDKKEFLFINPKSFSTINFSKNNSNKKEIVLELKTKNLDLTNKAEHSLKNIPHDIEVVLNDYLDKISSLEFLDELQSIDEQTNVLRTMLNINIK